MSRIRKQSTILCESHVIIVYEDRRNIKVSPSRKTGGYNIESKYSQSKSKQHSNMKI